MPISIYQGGCSRKASKPTTIFHVGIDFSVHFKGNWLHFFVPLEYTYVLHCKCDTYLMRDSQRLHKVLTLCKSSTFLITIVNQNILLFWRFLSELLFFSENSERTLLHFLLNPVEVQFEFSLKKLEFFIKKKKNCMHAACLKRPCCL